MFMLQNFLFWTTIHNIELLFFLYSVSIFIQCFPFKFGRLIAETNPCSSVVLKASLLQERDLYFVHFFQIAAIMP